MQCACTVFSSVTSPAVQYFLTSSHEQHDFQNNNKKIVLNMNCVFRFSLHVLSEIFLILGRNERDVIKSVIGIHVQYSLFLPDFNETWNFLDRFSKNTQDTKFRENPSSGSQTVLCGRTDMTKLTVAFCNFANAPKNE
jgi:hypothetical protein